MTIKDIKEAMENECVFFGIKQPLKNKNNLGAVFIAKDARDETVERLEGADIEFVVLRPKAEMARELNLDFESEVISIIKKKSIPKK